ncbi:MAG: hypothetical protein WCG14_00990 [Chlamydiia bacterium]
MKVIWCWLSLGLVAVGGCSPTSPDDFRHEGQAVTRELLRDLQGVLTREDLVAIEPVFKKRFERLALIMIQARQFQIDNPEAVLSSLTPYSVELNDQLQEELLRIYRIETGQSIIEKAQREAMLRLDGFENGLGKRIKN